MKRDPFSTSEFDIAYLKKGAVSCWLLVNGFFLSLGFAIKQFGPVSLVIGLFSLFLLGVFILKLSDQEEINTLYKQVKWYRVYTNLTFLTAMIIGLSLPFESSKVVALVLGLPALINGFFIWPYFTGELYLEKYTDLFGRLDV